MSKETPQQPKNWKRMLSAIPNHNTAAKVVERNGCVKVIIKNIRPAYLVPPISWFVPYKPQREITLDPLGTYLWKLCDGKKTVENLIDQFKDEYELTFHEAKTCVTDYLRKLVQRGILAVVLDQ